MQVASLGFVPAALSHASIFLVWHRVFEIVLRLGAALMDWIRLCGAIGEVDGAFLPLGCKCHILLALQSFLLDNHRIGVLHFTWMEHHSSERCDTRFSERGSSAGEASARQTGHCPQASKDAVWRVTRNSRTKGFSNVAEVLWISTARGAEA